MHLKPLNRQASDHACLIQDRFVQYRQYGTKAVLAARNHEALNCMAES